jgi:hypothetical protein
MTTKARCVFCLATLGEVAEDAPRCPDHPDAEPVIYEEENGD